MRTLAADLDGTIYKGNTLLPKVKETYHVLKQLEINTIFITNNSSQTPEEIKTKLDKLLQDKISLKNIITPLMIIKNVSELTTLKVHVYGSSGVKNYLEQFNEKIVSIQEA